MAEGVSLVLAGLVLDVADVVMSFIGFCSTLAEPISCTLRQAFSKLLGRSGEKGSEVQYRRASPAIYASGCPPVLVPQESFFGPGCKDRELIANLRSHITGHDHSRR